MSETKQKKEKKDRPLTPEQDRHVKKLGIEKSLKGVNPLSYEALQKILAHFKDNSELEEQIGLTHDDENEYKLFVKALNRGAFPGQGKNAAEFLKALKGSAEERKIAKKFISDLAHGEGQISISKEKTILNELKKAKEQNNVDEAQKKVGTSIDVISNTAATWGKFNEILDKGERAQLNYKAEKLPEKTNEQLKKISGLNLATKEALKLEKELEALMKSPDFEKKSAKQERAKIIEKELEALDEKIDKIVLEILGEKEAKEVTPELLQKFSEKLKDLNYEVVPLMERELRRADALRTLSKKAGVQNINNTKTFKIRKFDKQGNVFSKERERIKIEKIYFEEDDVYPEAVGPLMIRYSYMDREGQENKILEISEVNFMKDFVYLLDAVEDETLAKNPQKKEYMPEVGEVFTSDSLGQFKVTEVKGDKITTDKELKVIPKERLSKTLSTNEELYQDQNKKEFNKKEFNKVLLQHDCHTGDKAERYLPDEILEDAIYPDSLEEPQKEEEEEIKKEKNEIEEEAKEEIEKLGKELDEGGKEGKLLKEAPPLENKNKKPYWEEVVPYEDIHHVNDMEKPAIDGALKKFYNETRFLSVSDIFHLVKACWDYYIRKFERKQKEKYSSIAKNLPYFGGEMERINQSAENEEVHQFEETYEHKGITFVQERMRITNDKDEMKACFLVLSKKGQMRFEDIDMWRNMNKFIPHAKYIPIPRNGDPNTVVSDDPNHPHYLKTGVSFLEGAVDYLWGPGTYGEWYAHNESGYDSNAKKFYSEGERLEGVEGEHTRRLGELLMEHVEGNFVDPQEYEGLILHSIEAGKVDLETKIYYMVAGVTKKNPAGRALLPYDRIAHINSKMLARFPIMEYMCAKAPRVKRYGKEEKDIGKERLGLQDYEHWLHYFDGGNHHNVRPTKNVTKFIWKYLIPSEKTHTRINKALRNAEGMDHDDMHAYLPPASTEVLTNACKTVGGGGKHLLTIEGYANAVAGFDEYIKNLAINGQTKQMAQAFCSYTRYEAILNKKWNKTKTEGFIRMDDRTLNKRCVVTANPPILYMKELDSLMLRVAKAYEAKGHPELLEKLNLIQINTKMWDMSDPKNKKKQDQIQHALETFDDTFMRTVKSDGGEGMLQIAREAAAVPLTKDGIAQEGGLSGIDAGYKGTETEFPAH